LAKTPLISLIKPIEATKLHPRTGMSLGQPDVTVPYGALIEHKGSDGGRERFTYLSELYACKRDAFESATGGEKSPPKPAAAAAPAPAPVVEEPPEPAAAREPRLEWDQVKTSDPTVWRAAVPGGWLVALNGSSLTFVPDPKHQWDGGSPE
jgi:hypothetical protein